MMRRHGNVGLAVLVVGVVALSSCSSGSSGGSSSHSTVDVFAASSLTDAFTRIGKDFEDHQHNRTATFSFAGSQALAAQIGEGAPADVLATADTTTMAEVQNELLADPQTLAHNRLVIVTDKGNPRD
ncbi:MAG: molybdate transport system substrate-binding protein, partial [Frankiaceae bacterium]|nr:molybdate transport system substrate-binding protein [Frankiaceae bacterium]